MRGTRDVRVPNINPRLFGGNVLSLIFDDVPFDKWADPDGVTWTGPTEEQVGSAIAFARQFPDVPIAVHCKHGKSRSAALAFAIIADRMGPGREPMAVKELLRYDSSGPIKRLIKRVLLGPNLGEQMVPNPLIVNLSDALLRRKGRLAGALTRGCPNYVRWCAYWEERRPPLTMLAMAPSVAQAGAHTKIIVPGAMGSG